MTKLCTLIGKLLSCPVFVNAGIIGVSVFSLAAAFTAQYGFGLEPCILCLIQRGPFVAAALLGAAGLFLALRGGEKASAILIAVSGVTFLVNSAVAFYHTGVERHWWRSVLEGCSVPDLGTTPEDLLKAIQSAPVARCDEIPWADPWLGLSMANYNVLMCLGLAAGCALCSVLILRRLKNGAPPP